MRVKRKKSGYTLFVTDSEFALLQTMETWVKASVKDFKAGLGEGGRRSLGRRCGPNWKREMFRVDNDKSG